MSSLQIRVITICIIRKGDSILVFEGYDRVKDQIFYRPLGGGVEYGEHSSEAILREFREELGAELINLRYMNTFENTFTFEGNSGHEIVIIYKGDFADESFYSKDIIIGKEDNGNDFKAMWKSILDFRNEQLPLYPDRLLELL
ncbi:MAG: NUDIX domain-containing protein [Anaerolineae bacterium]|jgi:8-oxo-dGTP pyrophosphatase MutT (NUDIX family)|nr:NUDIX domain-containing protein [Anaerolineae bacterium]